MLASYPSTPCGACLGGRVVCTSADTVACVGADDGLNACGGCAPLGVELGEACGTCAGAWQCHPSDPDRAVCDDPAANACGGCAPLAGSPSEACPGGSWFCADADTVECGDIATNPCGGDVPLLFPPGDPCGACDDGRYLCAGPNQIACVGGTEPNICGGCGLVAGTPGEKCVIGHEWVCEAGHLRCLLVASPPFPSEAGAVCETDNECANRLCAAADDTAYCAFYCEAGACPLGFECSSSRSSGGVDVEACLPIIGCLDADEDGYGVGRDCLALDCDDDAPRVNPEARELCNGIDDDCDGRIDLAAADVETWWADGDRDGYGSDLASVEACEQPFGYVGPSGDCDDTRPTTWPGAPELCDGEDNDCDDEVDEGIPGVGGPCTAGVGECTADGEFVCTPDGRGTICSVLVGFPPGTEACDSGADDDCDGDVDCDDTDCDHDAACTERWFSVRFAGAGEGLPNQRLVDAVTLQLVDGDGEPLAELVPVVFTSSPPMRLEPAGATTDASGLITLSVVLGRASGTYVVTARAVGVADAEAAFTAVVPESGTLIPIYGAISLSACLLDDPWAICRNEAGFTDAVVASDGTIYAAESATIQRIAPDGTREAIAGTGTPGSTGDGGPALGARVESPDRLALDEERQLLYLWEPPIIRVVDLGAPVPTIDRFAGGGSLGGPGDGGYALDATLTDIGDMTVFPDGSLVVLDPDIPRVRRIRPDGVIEAWFDSGDCDATEQLGVVLGSGSSSFDGLEALSDGRLLVAAENACGTELVLSDAGSGGRIVAAEGVDAIVLVEDGQATHVVAGSEDGTSEEADYDARFTNFGGQIGPMAHAPDGGLYVWRSASTTGARVVHIAPETRHLRTIAGEAAENTFHEYADAATGGLPALDPRLVNLDVDGEGNVYIIDRYSARIEMIVAPVLPEPVELSLGLVDGDGQEVVFHNIAAPVEVSVTDDTGTGVSQMWVSGFAQAVGAWPQVRSAVTDADGAGRFSFRTSRTLGAQTFRIERTDIFGAHVTGSPLTVTFDVVAPPPGMVVPLVNVGAALTVLSPAVLDDLAALFPVPALAIDPSGYHISLAVAPDDTIYFSASNRTRSVVFAIDPDGVVRHVAGGDRLGDPVLATVAALGDVRTISLDDDGGWLYLGHANPEGDWVISRVGVRSGAPEAGRIERVAGGGSATTEPWGDGGDAAEATFGRLGDIAVAADSSVLVFDIDRRRIRRIRFAGDTATIESWLDATAGANYTRPYVTVGPGGAIYFECAFPGPVYGTCVAELESPVAAIVVREQAGAGMGLAVLDGGVVVRDGPSLGIDLSRYDPDEGFESVWMEPGTARTGEFADVGRAHAGSVQSIVAWGEHLIVASSLGPIRLIW